MSMAEEPRTALVHAHSRGYELGHASSHDEATEGVPLQTSTAKSQHTWVLGQSARPHDWATGSWPQTSKAKAGGAGLGKAA